MSDQTPMSSEPDEKRSRSTRRRFVGAIGAVTGTGLLAGCGGNGNGDGDGTPTPTDDGTGVETDEPTETEEETDTEEPTESETETETPSEEASVRVTHLSPDAPNVDVAVDDSTVLEDVEFGTVSDYLALAAGDHTVTITPTGGDEPVFDGDVTVEAEQAYTIAAIGEVSEDADQEFEPLILEDDREAPDSDTARVRVVHVSPDAPAVDVTVGDGETVLFDGVEYGESGSTEVPADDYTLEIRGDTEENDGDVAAEFDVSLEGETAYSAFAAGYLTPDDEPADTPFDLVVAQDSEMAE